MRSYTHVKGFNITGLEGVVGIYLLIDKDKQVKYVGASKADFKNRLQSHYYHPSQKLTDDINYLCVIKTDPRNQTVLHVLEHLIIRYFQPDRNKGGWLFFGGKAAYKNIAIDNGLKIESNNIKDYLLEFDACLIKREWFENGEFKKYGEVQKFADNIICCTNEYNCLCYNCLVDRYDA
ncbi:GIY-YIG nuclease family protein [Thalassobacillus devorans]|uniref:GIY-YIG nuclease family protein n=1 Tax=Thalassobacillus devorans TaxID=279813 RepID=UPI000A1CE69D|nr:GIY-YIG nuclease family protein [Thalassobacillus devorans]